MEGKFLFFLEFVSKQSVKSNKNERSLLYVFYKQTPLA